MTLQAQIKWVTNLADFKKSVDEGTGVVVAHTAKVDKLVTSLSGGGLFGAVNNAIGAFEKLGGVQKLTGAEMERYNALVTKAIDKAQVMGREIPEAWLAIQAATARANVTVEQMPAHLKRVEEQSTLASRAGGVLSSTFGQVFSAFSAAGIVNQLVGGLVSLARGAVQSAGALVDLSNKTGLSTETLQRMQFVAKQSGSDMGTFADAVFKMGLNIAEGTGKARNGAESLGLSWEQLRAASPDQQFQMVVQALERMEDPQKRNEAAVALFGKTAKEILPAIVDGYSKIAGQAKVASDAQIRAVDAASDAWDAFVERQKTSITTWLGNMVIARAEVGKLTAEQQSQYAAILKSGGDAEAFLLKLAAQAQNTGKDIYLATPKPIPPAFTESLKLAEEGFKKLTSSKLAEINAALALGKSNDDIINGLNITDGVLQLAKKAHQDQAEAVKKATAAAEAHTKALKDNERALVPLTDAQKTFAIANDNLSRGVDVTALKFGISAKAVTTYLDSVKNATQIAEIWRKAHETMTDVTKKFADKADQDWKASQQKIADASSAALADQLRAVAQFSERRYQLTLSDSQRQLRQIELERQAAISALTQRFNLQGVLYAIALAQINAYYASVTKLAKQDELLRQLQELGRGFEELGRSFGNNVVGTITTGIGKMLPFFEQMKTQIKKVGEEGQKTALAIGQALSAVASVVGATSSGSRAQRVIGGALTGAMAGAATYAAFATTFSAQTFGISIAVGALAGAIVGWVAANRAAAASAKEAAGKLDDLKASLIAQYGSMENAAAVAGRFGLALEDSVGSSANDLQNLSKEAAALDQKLKDLASDVQKYGLAWTDLSDPADVFAEATKAAKPLVDSFTRLTQAGYDTGAVVDAMSGDVNIWLTSVLKAGTKIPPAMQPILEKLIAMGLLTDENKRKLLGLSDPNVLSGGTFDDVVAAAQRYGLELDALGPKVNQLNIDKVSQQLSSDWKLLTSDGEDVNAVMLAMQKQVQEVVSAAFKFGDTIPESMKPMLESMIKAGLLTDDVGQKLTDSSKINFAKPIEVAVEDLVSAIQALVDTMSQGVRFPIREEYIPDPARPGGTRADADPTGAETFHSGTAKVLPFVVAHNGLLPDEVPAILQTGEAVLNRRAVAAVGSGEISAMNRGDRRGGPTVHLTVNVHRPILRDKRGMRQLAQEITAEVPSVLTASGF